MVKLTKNQWKKKYFSNLSSKLIDYDKCFIVEVDNVRSKQMQQIRAKMRGTAELVMGKNTMIRKVIGQCQESKGILEKLLPCINQNIGFVFTKADLNEIRQMIEDNRVEAPAKAGTIAPCDVRIPKQNTGLGPEKTSFFQALSIQTKITRGTIEILNDVHLIHEGDKVGASEASLLSMLKIYPFTYGLVIRSVFDQGSVYSPDVLDITPEVIMSKFMNGVSNVAALSLATNFTTAASVPHLLAATFKKMLALSVATDYTPKEAEQIKEYLADPSKFASAAPAASSAAKDEKPAAAAKVEAPAESSDSDSDCGMGLFD